MGNVTINSREFPSIKAYNNRDKVYVHVIMGTKKDTDLKWGKSEQQSFDELKMCLGNAETLGYYDKKVPTQVIADASPVGLGGMLVQEQYIA